MNDLFNKSLLEKIGATLLKRNETIAVAESVTCGLLQFSFSNIPDASRFFQGGMTAYNLGQKYKYLGVEPLHAQRVNCVSQQVADQMSLHAASFFGSDWGIAITGYATPVPEGNHKLFAYYSICYKGKIKKAARMQTKKENPPEVQLHYANQIMTVLSQLL